MKTKTEASAELRIEIPAGVDIQTTSNIKPGEDITRVVTIRAYRHPSEDAAIAAIQETARIIYQALYTGGVDE